MTGRGYPLGQLAKAFVTAANHEDAETRRRAEERLRRSEQALSGMADGRLTIGSRTPVACLPAWVTPQVVRFPATILPNPLVRELDVLAREAGLELPFVEELAADIFMGAFSAKFLHAAQLAADLLEGSLYERYYGIDYGVVRRIDDVAKRRRFFARTSETFASLCAARAVGPANRWSVSANGMVIEQSQILTTHNLATLVQPVGVAPTPGWPELARRSFRAVWQLVSRVRNNPRPLGTIKDAAYAWRQTLLYLALTSHDDQAAFVAWAREQVRAQPASTTERLAPVVAGLEHVLVGGTFDADGVAGDARRFLGWAVGGHWMQPRKAEARR